MGRTFQSCKNAADRTQLREEAGVAVARLYRLTTDAIALLSAAVQQREDTLTVQLKTLEFLRDGGRFSSDELDQATHAVRIAIVELDACRSQVQGMNDRLAATRGVLGV